MSEQLEKIYEKIKWIATLNQEDALKEIKKLIQELDFPNVKHVVDRNWTYFYIYDTEYNPETKKTKEINLQPIGKIPKALYAKYPKKIKDLKLPNLLDFIERYGKITTTKERGINKNE
ncbi:MAG: hypothetical protein R6W84_04125 [Promethearchaeia archaeon]